MSRKRNYLIVGDASSIFIYEFIKNVLSEDWKITIANTAAINRLIPEKYRSYYNKENIKVINCGLVEMSRCHMLNILISLLIDPIKILSIARRGFEVVHIHFIGWNSRFLYFLRKDIKVLTTIYGSDLLRARNTELGWKKRIIKRADYITIETRELKKAFIEKFTHQYDTKLVCAGFGSENIDYIWRAKGEYSKIECKEKNGYPTDKIVIFIGYNGSEAQQHVHVLSELEKLSTSIKDKLFLVMHCSYGLSHTYHKKLEECLRKTEISGIVDTRYLIGTELAQLRLSADLFLNMQKTDVLSSSMLEFMVGNSVIIQGSWLKYAELENAKVEIIDKIEQINKRIIRISDNIEYYRNQCIENASIAYSLLAWGKKKDAWRKIL